MNYNYFIALNKSIYRRVKSLNELQTGDDITVVEIPLHSNQLLREIEHFWNVGSIAFETKAIFEFMRALNMPITAENRVAVGEYLKEVFS